MPLSKREQEVLDRLMQKKDEPARSPVGKSISVHIDLSDDSQIARAKQYGFLDEDEDMFEDEEQEQTSDNGGDETPKRRGFFDS